MTGIKFCSGHFVSRNGGMRTRLLKVRVSTLLGSSQLVTTCIFNGRGKNGGVSQ